MNRWWTWWEFWRMAWWITLTIFIGSPLIRNHVGWAVVCVALILYDIHTFRKAWKEKTAE